MAKDEPVLVYSFLAGAKIQGHILSQWLSDVEIKVRLFVAVGMLLSPQGQQKRRKLRKDNLRPVDLPVTSRTESNHQKMQNRLARLPTVDARFGITAPLQAYPSRSKTCSRRPPKYSASCRFSV
jgi:hypothetical protein